jgi:hypothetical protein
MALPEESISNLADCHTTLLIRESTAADDAAVGELLVIAYDTRRRDR